MEVLKVCVLKEKISTKSVIPSLEYRILQKKLLVNLYQLRIVSDIETEAYMFVKNECETILYVFPCVQKYCKRVF